MKKQRPAFHYADVTKSARLQRVVALLKKRGKKGATTREILFYAKVCSPCGPELRKNGLKVVCTFDHTDPQTKSKIYRHVLEV
jgi:hypothetical protein